MEMPPYFLPRPPATPDAAMEAAFQALYAAQIAPGDGGLIAYSLSAPRWQFLCWLADTQAVLLHGSGNGGIMEFEPRKSDDIDEFGNRRAVYAASDGLWPIYFAIIDRERYWVSLSNGCFRVVEDAGGLSEPFYFFSINQEALDQRPWRPGFVYILPRASFEQQAPLRSDGLVAHVAQWASLLPVRPLAQVAVGPEDFPFLDQIRGHDVPTLLRRAAANPSGFPWLDEEEQ